MNTAIILTGGFLNSDVAKTAHGLIRGSERYKIAGIIDAPNAGKDAGEILDGRIRNIPVFFSVDEALSKIDEINYCIIGIATIGGILPQEMLPVIETCIRKKISIVNGLHEFLCEKKTLVELAKQNNVELIDVRKPKPKTQLHFWSGEIFTVTAPIIAVMGMDCAMGKRTTCRMIREACEKENINAQMIYTGQTGWLQGGKFGFILDSTLNDFISGELEHAVVSCWKKTNADVILIEGQSALRNPSGPCGIEYLISGNAKHTVLLHAPKRKYYDNLPEWGEIPTVESEIEIINKFGAQVLALALNTEHCTTEETFQFQKHYEEKLNIPVLLPLQQGVDKLIPFIKQLIYK